MFPKVVHLTCKDKQNINNRTWINCIQEYKLIYKDYEIKIYDDKDIYVIVEKHFKEHSDDIKKVKIGAVLADIFRYLILYLEGGIYSDMDCLPLKPIDSLLDYNTIFLHDDENREYKDKYFIHECDKCILNSTLETYKCLGHRYINKKTDVIVSYEFYPGQTCQWFIIGKPKQKLFLDCFNKCMKNINILQNLNKYSNELDSLVMKNCGPHLFTEILLSDKTSNVCILPEVFFCCGSNGIVPMTKSSYVKHYFMGSWR